MGGMGKACKMRCLFLSACCFFGCSRWLTILCSIRRQGATRLYGKTWRNGRGCTGRALQRKIQSRAMDGPVDDEREGGEMISRVCDCSSRAVRMGGSSRGGARAAAD